MVMRVGGIASGMDIEAMVQKLMEAERMPLDRLKQQQTTLTWKRDAFREINSTFLEFKNKNMLLDMKLSSTYNPKTATSSQESAVTATANSSASNGSYEVQVKSLATSAMNISTGEVSSKISFENKSNIEFTTFNEDGTPEPHSFDVDENDTLKDVLKKIETASGNRVRAFYDESSKKVVLETTRTGIYNPERTVEETGETNDYPEIIFDGENGFFATILNLDQKKEKPAHNAEFTYNNHLDLNSRDNSYTLNGITFQFHNVTQDNARITVNTDVEKSFESIMKFVDKYNEAIEQMNKSQTEERFRDFKPLSDEQKEEMSEKQIEQWEEKAKSGILRGESVIRDGMYSLRESLQGVVETGGEYTLLSHIGIETTQNYLDGGKLKVNEEKLKEALRDHPDDVYKLFAGTGDNDGLIHRFEKEVDNVKGRIEKQAGKASHTLDNYTIGKRMKEVNERISDFERRMIQVEQRYWNQFTAMEKAISNLNQQSSYLFSQFGGGM